MWTVLEPERDSMRRYLIKPQNKPTDDQFRFNHPRRRWDTFDTVFYFGPDDRQRNPFFICRPPGGRVGECVPVNRGKQRPFSLWMFFLVRSRGAFKLFYVPTFINLLSALLRGVECPVVTITRPTTTNVPVSFAGNSPTPSDIQQGSFSIFRKIKSNSCKLEECANESLPLSPSLP